MCRLRKVPSAHHPGRSFLDPDSILKQLGLRLLVRYSPDLVTAVIYNEKRSVFSHGQPNWPIPETQSPVVFAKHPARQKITDILRQACRS